MIFDTSEVIFSKKDKKRRLVLPTELSSELAEEIGIHIGDGSLNIYKSRYLYSLRGHKIDDEKYYINFVTLLYRSLFGIDVKIRRWPDVIGFQIGSNALGEFKSKIIGLPLGPKIEIKIPNFILESNNFSADCMRGIFDTDGCLSFEKKSREKAYYPRILFTNTSKALTEDIIEILKDKLGFNLSSWHKDYKDRNWKRLYYICTRGSNNLIKWFKIIGSHNPKYLFKFEFWNRNGYAPVAQTDFSLNGLDLEK